MIKIIKNIKTRICPKIAFDFAFEIEIYLFS